MPKGLVVHGTKGANLRKIRFPKTHPVHAWLRCRVRSSRNGIPKLAGTVPIEFPLRYMQMLPRYVPVVWDRPGLVPHLDSIVDIGHLGDNRVA